jgi:hypothetical protein
MDPLSVENWPGAYFDHNGDDRATALDALRVINELARVDIDPESSEGETVIAALEEPKGLAGAGLDQADDSTVETAVRLTAGGFVNGTPVANSGTAATVVQQGYDPDETARAVDQLLSDESFVDLL